MAFVAAFGSRCHSEEGMTTFDKREDSFEKQFAHDEELRFRAEARRNKLLGLWAAEKLGKTGADADAYSREVIAADVEERGEEDVYRKLRRDFDAAGLDVSEHRIRRAMSEFMGQAMAQIKTAG
jgi:hypothetical protein